MPEGPSILILKEQASLFRGKTIVSVSGNTKVDVSGIAGQLVVDVCSWGKHFLIRLADRTIRIHFMLFGSYSINEKTKPNPRLHLEFANGDLYFYACSVKILLGDLYKLYDWSADVMNDRWDAKQARKKLKAMPDVLVADALLDQAVFAGVGNIIKNEVLFRIRVHPMSLVGALSPRKLGEMIREARDYSFDFLEWKKAYELRKNWLVHAKSICPRCVIPLVRVQHLGRRKRRAFFCENCQKLYV